MIDTSKIFISEKYMKSNQERIAKNKYEELLFEIIKLIKADRLIKEFQIEVYSSTLDIKYTRRAQTLATEPKLGCLTTRYDNVDKSMAGYHLFINADKIKSSVEDAVGVELAKDLCIEDTFTNFFIYVVLHELGHYTQYEYLNKKKQVEQLLKFRRNVGELLKVMSEEDVYNHFSLDEKFADMFACQKIHRVIKELEEINPEYLTYLDNI